MALVQATREQNILYTIFDSVCTFEPALSQRLFQFCRTWEFVIPRKDPRTLLRADSEPQPWIRIGLTSS